MQSDRGTMLVQGLVAGLIGYVAVALVFALANVGMGRPVLYTAQALGEAFFFGGEVPAEAGMAGPVFAYNGFHLLVSLVVGLAASWIVYETEKHHALWYLALMAFLGGFIFSVVAVGALGVEVAGVLPWWAALVGNLAWAAGIGGYLWWYHRDLYSDIQRDQTVGVQG